MKPTNAGVIPNASAAFCTDSTKISLTSATNTVTPASVARARPNGPGRFAVLGVFRAGKQLAVRLEREQHAQSVGNDEQHRQTYAQLARERRPALPSRLCATADGISRATVARKSRPACMRALTRLYS